MKHVVEFTSSCGCGVKEIKGKKKDLVVKEMENIQASAPGPHLDDFKYVQQDDEGVK